MKKIRINELARELEVKAHEILERLPELGVTEKKTHSSSIDEDVALKLRRYYGQNVPELEETAGTAVETEEEAPVEAAPEPASAPAVPRPTMTTPPAPASAPVEERYAAEESRAAAPIRPPLGTGRPVHPPLGVPGQAPRRRRRRQARLCPAGRCPRQPNHYPLRLPRRRRDPVRFYPAHGNRFRQRRRKACAPELLARSALRRGRR
jgi:translation initiation factor IF-2